MFYYLAYTYNCPFSSEIIYKELRREMRSIDILLLGNHILITVLFLQTIHVSAELSVIARENLKER